MAAYPIPGSMRTRKALALLLDFLGLRADINPWGGMVLRRISGQERDGRTCLGVIPNLETGEHGTHELACEALTRASLALKALGILDSRGNIIESKREKVG